VLLTAVVLEKTMAEATAFVRRADFVKLKTFRLLGVKKNPVMRGHERFAHRRAHGIPRDPMPKVREPIQGGRVMSEPFGDVVEKDTAGRLGHAHQFANPLL